MAKVGEKIWYDETSGKMIHQKQHDFTQEMRMAAAARELHGGKQGENRLVGVIPTALINEWLKAAGVDWSDHGAVQEIIKRNILSGEFDKFRVWKGTY